MTNEACAPCQDKQPIQASIFNKLIDLRIFEGTAASKHVNEASSNTTIHVQNEVSLLGRGDLLNTQSKIEHFMLCKIFGCEVLDKLDTHVWICLALDTVANAH